MKQWEDAALLLVGHGSSRVKTSRQATARLAEAIRQRSLFAEVQECFWREPPFLSLDLVTASTVFVVPNFSGEGLFTGQLIPQKLGLTGACTGRSGRRIIYARPVGAHPALAAMLKSRAEGLCAAQDVSPAATALLVVGHGSSRPEGSSVTPERVAATIRDTGHFAEVATAFIEQAPRVADWRRLIAAPNVVVAPLLISEGMHARNDLPPLFGLAAATSGGPSLIDGRRVWLMGGIGQDAQVIEMILDQVRAAEAAAEKEERR